MFESVWVCIRARGTCVSVWGAVGDCECMCMCECVGVVYACFLEFPLL